MGPVGANLFSDCRLNCRAAFSFVEMMVVVLIVGLLVSMLLPTIARVRAQANLIKCMSNERQLCQALIAYASENKGKFPPNRSSPTPGQYWSDADRLGALFNVNSYTGLNGNMTGPLFTCPEDPGSVRTYAMNIWASSGVDSWVLKPFSGPVLGSLWSFNVARAPSMILIGECWSYFQPTSDFQCSPDFGNIGLTTGQRFGGGGGITPFNAGRWGEVNCELAYMLHRARNAAGRSTQPIGCINLGYADGHVATKSNQDLVNYASGVSTNDSFFSPLDFQGQ